MEIAVLSSLWMDGSLPWLTWILVRSSCFLSRLFFLDVLADGGVAMLARQPVVELSLEVEAVAGAPVFGEVGPFVTFVQQNLRVRVALLTTVRIFLLIQSYG